MKRPSGLLLACLILFLPHPTQTQETADGDVFDCRVTQVTHRLVTVACNTRNQDVRCKTRSYRDDPNCIRTYLDIPLEEFHLFSAWQFAPMDSFNETPRRRTVPAKGELLKGQWDEYGHFKSVASCEMRIRENIEAYCGGSYCRPPINSLTPPDCGRKRWDGK